MSDVHWSRAAVLRLAVASLVLVGALFVFVFPTSALLNQRGQTNAAEQRLSVLKDQSERLEEQTKRVRSDHEIERLARDRFNMVRPGEQAWAVVPAPLPTTTTTVAPPTPPSLPAVP